MRNTLRSILILVTFIVVTSCQKNHNFELSDPLFFKEYISVYTSGVVSTHAPITITTNANITAKDVENIKAKELFSISPSVKGKIMLIGHQVQFIPSEPLQQDKKYNVSFHLSKLFEVDASLEDFNFSFTTIKQHISVELDYLKTYNGAQYSLDGTIFSSDQLEVDKAEKLVKTFIKGKEVPLKIIGSQKKSTNYHFVIDSIFPENVSQKLKITWNGNSYNINSKGVKEIEIPAQSEFKVLGIHQNGENSKSFVINFSKPLVKSQNFRGLIKANGKSSLTFSSQGNVLKVYARQPFKENVNVNIFHGIKATNGKKISSDTQFTLSFEGQKPAVRFLNSGTILPGDIQNAKINFEAVGLRAVKVKVYRIYQNNVLQFLQDANLGSLYSINKVGLPVAEKVILLTGKGANSLKKWNAYAVNISSLVKSELGAMYRVELSIKRKYAVSLCSDDKQWSDSDLLADDGQENTYDNYNWNERKDPCKESYYFDKKIQKNILVSNLGVIIKKEQTNHYWVAVTDLLTALPVKDATVKLYNYQQQEIGRGKTNGEGILEIANEKEVYFVVASKGEHVTYAKIASGYSQSLSNFDVDGTKLQKGINGYIYADRGVWRPGDSIFIGFILNDKAHKLPKNHPVKFTLLDPNQKVKMQRVQGVKENNLYTFKAKTLSTAITGNWQAIINVGAAEFKKTIKVETIKPNRYKLINSLANSFITTSGDYGTVKVKWLHGAIAENTAVDIKVKMYLQQTTFKGYKNYKFASIIRDFKSVEMPVFKGKTDMDGQIKFQFKPKAISTAPGMLKVFFLTKATEKGGDFSTDVATASYSPFKNYVGLKMPELNKYGYVETNKHQTFNVVSLSEKGKPIPHRKIKVQVYRTSWNWWWDASHGHISNFSASELKSEYKSMMITTNSAGKADFKMNVNNSDWGCYVVVATDINSGHSTSDIITFDWGYWNAKSGKNRKSEATLLALSTDKKEYDIDEKATISFPSDEGARALVSVENSSRVLKTYWVKTTNGETTFDFPIAKEMSPNVYVYVTLIQPHQKTVNDTPIRLYGIVPIKVVDKSTQLHPEIKMSNILLPNKKASIKVKEKQGKAMTYTLAIVEEGLLDLTRFKTPNPWEYFFAKTALGVKTWDIYNDVIGAYGGTLNQVFSIGGDMNVGGGKAKKANRFKPLVIFKGPFDLKKGKTATHEIEIPNYIGSARVMVVAANTEANAYGAADKAVPVRSPLMILGSLPRKTTPSEKITLPVTVFAMENKVKDVKITVKTDDKLWVENTKTKELHFDKIGEKMVYFNLAVGKLTGISKVTIEAVSGNEKASYEVEMGIINPNTRTYQQQNIVLSKGEASTINWNAFGISGTNKASLEISSFPGVNLEQRMSYLTAYPHGCGEQITSKAFPQLYLSDFVELTSDEKAKSQKNINTAIQKLTEHQLSNGGFSYWKGGRYANDWVTNYIGHFYTEAEAKGYAIPAGIKNNWLLYQQRAARNWRYEARYQNDFLQAYRLYTLALAGKPELASMNRLREIPNISNHAKLRLAAAYALLSQKKVANLLFSKVTFNNFSNRSYYGSEIRNKAMALQTAMAIDRKVKASELALDISKKLSSIDWMSTQTTAFALAAMADYVRKNKIGTSIDVVLNYNGNNENIHSKNTLIAKKLTAVANENQLSIQNKSKQTVYVKLLNSGVLPVGEELSQNNGLAVRVAYKNHLKNTIAIDKLSQGTEFTAEISVKNTSQKRVDNIALTQLIPSGWEIMNTRYTGYTNQAGKIDHSDIRDDRVLYYFSLKANEYRVFTVQLVASYLGTYYLPGSYAEAMYNHAYTARTKGQWVEVVK